MKQTSQVIFERNSVEFVTVAAEFCAFVERCEGMKRAEFVDTLLKILPLLYYIILQIDAQTISF